MKHLHQPERDMTKRPGHSPARLCSVCGRRIVWIEQLADRQGHWRAVG